MTRSVARIRSVVVLFAFLSLPLGHAFAAGAGEAGFDFLKMGTDARAEALGGAHVALTDGVSALYYNPAGMVWSPPGQVLATYHNWVTDIQSGFVGGVLQMGNSGRIGVAVQYLDFGDIPAASVTGTAPGEARYFGASDLALSVSYAQKLGERSSAGVTARLIFEKIDDESAQGVAFDAGVIHQLPDQRTRIGAAIRNAGFQTSAYGESAKDELPMTAVAGISHHLRGAPLLFTVDAMKPYGDDFGAGAGVEFYALSPLTLRLGYNSLAGSFDSGSDSDKLAGMRFGAGFTLEKFVIDYGYGAMSELGSSHRFTIRTNVL
jgi:hypothetical protein